jgi:hypothetical protein
MFKKAVITMEENNEEPTISDDDFTLEELDDLYGTHFSPTYTQQFLN